VSEREGSQRERRASGAVRPALAPAGSAEERTSPVLDQRGRRCPLPVVELARAIGDVAVGETLGLAADDPAARLDVPAWCRMRGHDYLGESAAADGVPVYTVRRAR